MIARYNGICKATGQRIVAGVTEIQKIDGIWRIADGNQAGNGTILETWQICGKMELATTHSERTIPYGAVVVMAWSENDEDRWGDEIARHYVAFGNDDGDPIGRRWEMSSSDNARRFAHQIFDNAHGRLEDVIVEVFG